MANKIISRLCHKGAASLGFGRRVDGSALFRSNNQKHGLYKISH
jgi:hypothetical protein